MTLQESIRTKERMAPRELGAGNRLASECVWVCHGQDFQDEYWLRAVVAALAARGVRSVVVTSSGASALPITPSSSAVEQAAAGGGSWIHIPLRHGFRFDPRRREQERRLRKRFAGAPVFVFGVRALEHAARVTGTGAPLFLLQQSGDPAALAAATRLARTWRLPHDPAAVAAQRVPAGDVLPDAVLAPAWPLDRAAQRRALRLPRRTTLVLHVAPLVRDRGHELILRALVVLRESGTQLPTVAFLGTGPEESNLHVLCQDLQVKEHVLWLGHRRDVQPYLEAADVLVAPVAADATRGLLLAARAAGLVVLAPPGPTAAVQLRDGIDGRSVTGNTPQEWARALAGTLPDSQNGAAGGAAPQGGAARELVLAPAGSGADDAALELLCAVAAERMTRAGFARHRAALFLDRDGTLVRNVPYNRDPEAVQLEPRVVPALRSLCAAGFVPVVVSNQSGIARGLCTAAEVDAVNARLSSLLRAAGVEVAATYICPHHPDHTGPCDCRKPAPGLLLQAQHDLQLDLARSVLVGDSPADLQAAGRAGVRAYAYRNPAAPPEEGVGLVNPAGNWLELAWRILQDGSGGVAGASGART